MGFGLGAAIGAKIANPDKTVVNIAGDGSFHMNLTELATAAAYHVPIVELILNNEVLGMVRQWQKLFYDNRFSQTDVDTTTNFPALAEAFGLKAYTISTADEVEPVLRDALAQTGPVLIDCHIDRDINVLPMVPAALPWKADPRDGQLTRVTEKEAFFMEYTNSNPSPVKEYILSVLARNKAGVLLRIAGLLAAAATIS